MTEPATAAHAEFSPSSLNYIAACPGFRSRDDGDEKSKSKAADRGTAIHKALEKGDLDLLTDLDDRNIGQQLKDFVDGLVGDRLPVLPDKDCREIRLNIALDGGISTFGTADRLLVYGDHGIIIDYKTGMGAVPDAEDNFQCAAYTIGAFQSPRLALKTLDFYILLPQRDEVSQASFSRNDVPLLQLKINTVIRRAMEVDAHPEWLNPQPGLCQYCAMQTTCSALAAKALKVSQSIGDGLPVPANAVVDLSRPDDIPKLLRLAPLMEEWAKGIKAAALRLNLEEGLDIAGFRRVERSLPRSVNSVLGAWRVVKNQGITLEDFLSVCGSVSVPQLETFVASNAPRGQKGRAQEDLENALRGADVLNEGGKCFYLRESRK